MFRVFSILLTISLLLTTDLQGQNYLGQSNSNYGGMKSVGLQPASIADNRFAYDIQLGGANFTLWNNHVGLLRDEITTLDLTDPDDIDFEDFTTEVRGLDDDTDRKAFGGLDIHLPSFMISLNEKSSIAFNARWRNMVNVTRVGPEMAKLAYEGLDFEDLWQQDFSNPELNIQGMNWAEYGFTYSRVLMNEEENFLKGGATVKYLQGTAAGYLYARDFDYNFRNDDTLTIRDSDVAYGYSDNVSLDEDQIWGFDHEGRPSLGLDFGAVYEYRPDYEDYQYEDDDGETRFRPDKNKYKLKVGASVLDLGSIHFDKADVSRNFNADTTDWPLPDGFTDIDDFSETMNATFDEINDDGDFRMNLPTTLSLQVDYNIQDDFYVNFTSFYSPRFFFNEESLNNINHFSVTPRWETQNLGASLPVGVNEYGEFNMGLSLRMGPFTLGTKDLGTLFWKDEYTGLNLNVGLNIPIAHSDPTKPDPEPEPEPVDTPVVEEPEPEPDPEPEPEEPDFEDFTEEEMYDYLLENHSRFDHENLEFYVQLGAFQFEPVAGAFDHIEHLGELREIERDDMTRVVLAEWNTLEEADEVSQEVREIDQDIEAFVTPYYHNQRISVWELQELIEEAEED